MKFGIREICDVVFKAKKPGRLGQYSYKTGQPVLHINSAKTSTIESSATTVYAQGGKGNSRLIAWEGEKALTFTVEDALLSDRGLAILTGAGLWQNGKSGNVTRNKMPIHCYEEAKLVLAQEMNSLGTYLNPPSATIQLKNSPLKNPFSTFIFTKETLELFSEKCNLIITGEKIKNNYTWPYLNDDLTSHSVGKYFPKPLKDLYTEFYEKIFAMPMEERQDKTFKASIPVIVDYYTEAKATTTEFIIDAQNFAGYYYVEATTDFRRAVDGKDIKAMITFPNVKVQSNFTFSMAASGDPSTFSFVMDAMPGYTTNNPNKKVLCEMLIVDAKAGADNVDIVKNDSIKDRVWTDLEVGHLLKDGNEFKFPNLKTLVDANDAPPPEGECMLTIKAQLKEGTVGPQDGYLLHIGVKENGNIGLLTEQYSATAIDSALVEKLKGQSIGNYAVCTVPINQEFYVSSSTFEEDYGDNCTFVITGESSVFSRNMRYTVEVR